MRVCKPGLNAVLIQTRFKHPSPPPSLRVTVVVCLLCQVKSSQGLIFSEARKPYAEAVGHGRRGSCAWVWSPPPPDWSLVLHYFQSCKEFIDASRAHVSEYCSMPSSAVGSVGNDNQKAGALSLGCLGTATAAFMLLSGRILQHFRVNLTSRDLNIAHHGSPDEAV